MACCPEGEVPARHRRSSSRCCVYSGQAEVLFDASRARNLERHRGHRDAARLGQPSPVAGRLNEATLCWQERSASAQHDP